ncbi:DNA glycosylase [Rhodofomes roseus]|uniref:DNA glycosylase n=1 Tax=Rhodofomes roseus TaxID=34475 RepID=A0ABQ8K145_9APHY|nr:DNA glycosylase [Rhodofomes roseus]KAH9829938.1 DNA glycosylase [Rhodofomes roseus]
MSEPHRTHRTPKISAPHPVVRSPYFHCGPTRAEHLGTLPVLDALLSDCESEEREPDKSPYRRSRHFSPKTSALRSLSQTLPAPRAGEPAPGSLASPIACGAQTALQTHRSLSRNVAYSNFYDAFMRSFNGLYRAKPVLIQEHVAVDPWKLLVAVTLLNKTAGSNAIPVFFDLIEEWTTAHALAQACPCAVEERIRHLGLGKSRTKRLIKLSQAYLEYPPRHGVLRPSRCYITVRTRMRSADSENSAPPIIRRRYPPTCISHLPGSGPYALDSYRIFCGGSGEWKDVRPADKELAKYLKWKWAVAEFRRWDPFDGPGESIDLAYMQHLSVTLQCRTHTTSS